MNDDLKIIYFALAAYLILLVYASLMPFDFTLKLSLDHEIKSFWNNWPVNPNKRISGSDLVSNLALYFPLAFLISFLLRIKKIDIFRSILIPVLICSLISIFVEMGQMFSTSRVSSVSDWLLNSISAGAGSIFSILFGKKTIFFFTSLLLKKTKESKALLFLILFLFLAAADAFSPFTPSILLKDIWRSIKFSLFNPVSGFMVHPWHWWVVRGFIYFILTMLAYQVRKKDFLLISFLIFLFSFFLETGKIFIASRVFNSANIISTIVGISFAFFFNYLFNYQRYKKYRLEFSIFFLIFYIFYLAWFPFDFSFKLNDTTFFSPYKWLPFYDYAMGGTMNHARLFIQSIILQAALIFLLKLKFHSFPNNYKGLLLAGFICGSLGFIQEIFQIYLPTRTPSPTDIYCFSLGGIIGALGFPESLRYEKE